MPEAVGGVRSIYPQRPGRNDGNIYVGTTRNNILEGSLQRRFNQVVFGHGRQLWGLAVHPDDEVFATAGHDKNIALWRRHKLLWTTQVYFFFFFFSSSSSSFYFFLALLFLPFLLLLLFLVLLVFFFLFLFLGGFRVYMHSFPPFRGGSCRGLLRGSSFGARCGYRGCCGNPQSVRLAFVVHRLQSKYDIKRIVILFFFFPHRHKSHNLTFVQTAGEIVAMGSQNGSVYLFRVSRDGFSYKKSNKIRGTQPLVQLDWSSDSRFLQTVTQDYDLVFCNCRFHFFFIQRTNRSKSINFSNFQGT